jgi:hypothetical protein
MELRLAKCCRQAEKTKNNMIADLQKLISQNRIQEALDSLCEICEKNNSEPLLLSSRYKEIQSKYRKGLLTNDEYILAKNKITNSTLELIKQDTLGLKANQDKWKTKNDISISIKSKKETINLVVKLILKGEEYEIEAPYDIKSNELKESLIDELKIDETDTNGNQYEWKMIALNSGIIIKDELTLRECNLKDGEVIIFSVDLVAG